MTVTVSVCAVYRVKISSLCFERLAGKCPSIGFRHGAIEVIDELEQTLFQCFDGRKVASLDDSADNDAEPDFDLIKPGTVFRNVDKPDASFGGRQKRFACFLRLQNSGFAFDAQFL